MASGVPAANDYEQMSSEGGTASMKKRKESAPRDANYKMTRWPPACLLRTITNR
jgi:hypothetical protein